jgi:L-iditol 2-dehydrogenase
MGARVIVVDPLATRREVALKLGADAAIDPTDGGAAERIREMTGGHGADLVVEASGHDASIAAAFDYAREDGRMSMVGINIGRKVPVVIGQIQMKNLTVKGCIGSPGVWPAAIRFLERTGIDLSPIQTHDYALTDAVQAFSFGKDATKSIKITLLNG